MSHLVTIDLNEDTRLIIDAFNWILQTKSPSRDTGELDWSSNTNQFYPDLKRFAQGLLKQNIKTNVIDGLEVIEAIHQAESQVLHSVSLISKKIVG